MSAGHTRQMAPSIALPMDVIDVVFQDVAQAHVALGALIELLHGDTAPDLHGLAHLLSYIESRLERCDDLLSPHMTAGHSISS